MTDVGIGVPAGGRMFPAGQVWPAEPEQLSAIRAQVHRWLAPLALPRDDEHDLVLAVSEAASNAIEHAYRGGGADRGVELRLWLGSGTVCIAIVDRGTWCEPPMGPRLRGFGLEIMRRLVPGLTIDHGVRGTRVVLRHPLPGSPDGGTGRS